MVNRGVVRIDDHHLQWSARAIRTDHEETVRLLGDRPEGHLHGMTDVVISDTVLLGTLGDVHDNVRSRSPMRWPHGCRDVRQAVYSPTGQCSTLISDIGKSEGLPVARVACAVTAAAAIRQSAWCSVTPWAA